MYVFIPEGLPSFSFIARKISRATLRDVSMFSLRCLIRQVPEVHACSVNAGCGISEQTPEIPAI